MWKLFPFVCTETWLIYYWAHLVNYLLLIWQYFIRLGRELYNLQGLNHFKSLDLIQVPEKAMAPRSSTLAWKISWTEEPDGLQSMGSRRVGHDWETSLYFSLSCVGEGNGNPLQCSCLENPRDGGAWWAAVYGVAQSQTQLKQLSSSSSNQYIKIFSIKNFFTLL